MAKYNLTCLSCGRPFEASRRNVASLLAAQCELQSAGVAMGWCVEPGTALLGYARAKLAAAFLASGASHLLMVDSDIGWDAADVIRLLRHDVPLVAGICPHRHEAHAGQWALHQPPGALRDPGMGKEILTRQPGPGRTCTSPPWALTTCRTMASPRPAPGEAGTAFRKRSNKAKPSPTPSTATSPLTIYWRDALVRFFFAVTRLGAFTGALFGWRTPSAQLRRAGRRKPGQFQGRSHAPRAEADCST